MIVVSNITHSCHVVIKTNTLFALEQCSENDDLTNQWAQIKQLIMIP